MRTLTRTLAAAFGVSLIAAPVHGETCYTTGPAQFADAIHYCVSSVLPSQSGNSYGPQNLADGDPATAWCEGVGGQGIGETITLNITGGAPFRRLLIANGYGKSATSYTANSRPRLIEIETDRTPPTQVELVDQNGILPVYLMEAAPYRRVRITILSVYPGTRYTDTCVDFIGPDFEYDEMLLQQAQDSDIMSEPAAVEPPAVTPPQPAPLAGCLRSGEAFHGILATQTGAAGEVIFLLRLGGAACAELPDGVTVEGVEEVWLVPLAEDTRTLLAQIPNGVMLQVRGRLARTEGDAAGQIVLFGPEIEPY